MSGRVVVVGSAGADVVLLVERLPGPGETVLATDVQRGFGGKGANQAVAAAAAGAAVALIARVGDDDTGATYRERLAGLQVDVRGVSSTPGARTGTAYVMVDGAGENSIVVDPGANAALSPADLAPLADLVPGDVLLTQCEIPAETVAEAIRRAHGAGARVVLNLAPFTLLPPDVLSLVDPLVVNEEEAALLASSIPPGAGGAPGQPGSLLVTRGAGGASWGDLELPAVSVAPELVVDTTGAGDAFCGALAAALAAGADRETALGQALVAGAEAVRRVGAQPPG